MEFDSSIGIQKDSDINKKDKESVFSLTINPNINTKPGTSQYEELKAKMMKTTQEIFGSPLSFKPYIKFRNNKHDFNATYIKGIELKPTIEYGPQGRFHLQAFIKIKHRSNIQLNRELFVEKYAEGIGIKESQVYINIEVEGYKKKTNEEKMRDYVMKTRE